MLAWPNFLTFVAGKVMAGKLTNTDSGNQNLSMFCYCKNQYLVRDRKGNSANPKTMHENMFLIWILPV